MDRGKQQNKLHWQLAQNTCLFGTVGPLLSQGASPAQERSGLTERPAGKYWCLASVEMLDYMRPYSTVCARGAEYLSLRGFSSVWLFFNYF